MNTAAAQNAYDQVIQWVSFKLDGETYCIDVMKVQEVLRYTEIALFLAHHPMFLE